MGLIILGGKSNQPADVKDNRLDTSARTAPRAFYVSRDKGRAFSWTSTYSAAADEETAYIQNTSPTRILVIDKIIVSGIQATVHAVAIQTGGTAAGTPMTGVNLNKGNTNSAEATGFGSASVTGSVVGDIIGYGYLPATGSFVFDYGFSLILGQDDAIFIRSIVGTTGLVYNTIEGHFE